MTTPCGVELHRVDTPFQNAQFGVTTGGELLLQFAGRYKRHQRLVMHMAQITFRQIEKPAQTVIAAVLIKIGVKIADHGNTELFRCFHRRIPQRPFGHDLHDVGALLFPQTLQRVVLRKPKAHFFVKRQR